MKKIDSLMLPDSHDMPSDLAAKLRQARCLVLNSDYTPINLLPLSTFSWKDAIVNVFQEKVDIVEVYDDVFIRSASHKFKVPSIVVNRTFRKRKTQVEFCKPHVYLRDGYNCQYCGAHCTAGELTFDHWVPRAEGGKTTWENIVSACKTCNHRKGTQNRKRWVPRTKPYRPSYGELAAKARKRPIIIPDERWVPYLNWGGRIKVSNWDGHYIYGG